MTAAPKPARAKADPAYLALVRQLECIVCRTDVDVVPHHAIDGRYSQSSADDRAAIPLCPRCHRFRHDEPLRFALTIASDGELVIRTRAAVARLRANTIGRPASPGGRNTLRRGRYPPAPDGDQDV